MSTVISKQEANQFYSTAIRLLNEHNIPFLLGGAFALRKYTGIHRDTKDLDIFCMPENCNQILEKFKKCGFQTEITDPRWLAKAFKDEYFVDFIFSSTNQICTVDEHWFEHSQPGELFDSPVQYISPEDLLWSKIYIQNRERYDGADVNHIILKHGENLKWQRIWKVMEDHWEILLAQFMSFYFVYPSETNKIPEWIFNNLLEKAKQQYQSKPRNEKLCRGQMIDNTQYKIDINQWGFQDVVFVNHKNTFSQKNGNPENGNK